MVPFEFHRRVWNGTVGPTDVRGSGRRDDVLVLFMLPAFRKEKLEILTKIKNRSYKEGVGLETEPSALKSINNT